MVKNWRPLTVYSLVAMLTLWPLLGPGYILTLDMVFTPNLALPETVTSSYLLHATLYALNLIIPSDVLQKIMLLTILMLSGLGMHQLMLRLQLRNIPITISQWAAYASGLLYMINPFTYSRFMAGQYSVLLGYALLPFFVLALLRFLSHPYLKSSLILTTWIVVIGIVSIHTLGLAAIIVLITVTQFIWKNRAHSAALKSLAKYGLLVGSSFLVASSYWLLPLGLGNGPTATSIDTFATTDQSVFTTIGDDVGGKLMHVIRLQGFWAEGHNLFLLPQDMLSIWGLAAVGIWTLVIIGGIVTWRQKRETAALFTITIIVAALLATGVGTAWIASHVPFYAGYREPQKFVALIALSFAILVGFAIPKLVAITHTRFRQVCTAIVLLLVFVGFTPVMFGGFAGQLTPRQYPADWYAMNETLKDDTGNHTVLFLPWHLYMQYNFAGRVIANPGEKFFDKPLIISNDPELGNLKPAIADTDKQLLSASILPTAPMSNGLGNKLAPLGIKYILLAKDDDYQNYDYLNQQTDLVLISETTSFKLYRNTAFEEATR